MMRKLIAVAAVSGSLAFGAAGVIGLSGTAGASVVQSTAPATPSTSLAGDARFACAKAETLTTRIKAREAKATAWLPKAQAREAKATAAGHTKVADADLQPDQPLGRRSWQGQGQHSCWPRSPPTVRHRATSVSPEGR